MYYIFIYIIMKVSNCDQLENILQNINCFQLTNHDFYIFVYKDSVKMKSNIHDR